MHSATGYYQTDREREIAARVETHFEYGKRIGVRLIGWEENAQGGLIDLYLTADGETIVGQHDLMDRYGRPLQDKTNHPFYLAIAACKAAQAAVTTEGQQPSQPTGTSTTTENSETTIPTGPITIGIASSEPPLTVGQTISYLEAALIGNPKYAGMEVANITTQVSPNSGHVIRIVRLHGTGGAPPPSTTTSERSNRAGAFHVVTQRPRAVARYDHITGDVRTDRGKTSSTCA